MAASWLLVAAGGALLGRIGSAAGPGARPSLDPALAGSGAVAAVLGGFRGAAADALWLRGHVAWERRDAAMTERLVRAAVAADPGAEFFRINGARIIAHDLPHWRATPSTPAAVRARLSNEHAHRALELLGGIDGPGGSSPAVWVEMGRILHQQLGDLRGAAECYRRAAELPGAPYHAGRLHVELRVRAGEVRFARDWLHAWLQRLPPGDPAAERRAMEARLAELDGRLSAR